MIFSVCSGTYFCVPCHMIFWEVYVLFCKFWLFRELAFFVTCFLLLLLFLKKIKINAKFWLCALAKNEENAFCF